MRVFRIDEEGTFREYVEKPFAVDHEEVVLEQWLEANPDGILEDGRLLIIGRQVTTNLGGFIDLLGLDREGDVVVLELKRDRTPRDTLAQALEYASFAETLDADQLEGILRAYLNDPALELAAHHRAYFEIGRDEAVAFNKDQRIVIVGQEITEHVRQTASYLRGRGLRATCVEFSFFETEDGTKLLTEDIVVGREPVPTKAVSAGSLPVVNREQFLASLDENGRALLGRVLALADERKLPIHWGTRGFSLNADLDGTHVALAYGYPPASVFKQSLYSALMGRGGMRLKTAVPEDRLSALWAEAEATGLFVPGGKDLKCMIDRALTPAETESILSWLMKVEAVVQERGLKE